MNQEQIKHVCLETLSYDQIEEIEKGQYIKLLVHTPFSQHQFQSKRSMHEIINYLSYMKKYGMILNSITEKELSIIDQDYVQDQKNAIILLNKIFDEVLIRRDFLSRQCTLELLGLKHDDVKVSFKNKYLIPEQVKGFLLNDYSMVVSSIHLNGDLIAITLANNSKLQKFGKIWNLIEPELMGQLLIYSLSQILEEDKNPIKIYEKQYGFKLFDLDYEKGRNEFLVANCQGQIITYQKLEYENNVVIQEGSIIQVIPTSIYHLKIHNSEIYIITDNQIKILNDRYQIIGGGSLKSRLNGGYIQKMKFDQQYIFLGTDKGDLLIYKRTNNIEFITQIQVQGPIKNISFSQKYIFLVANNTLAIQKDTWVQTAEFKCGHKMIDFLLIKDNYFGITQDGLFVEWHRESAQIVQTLRFSSKNIYSIYRDQLVIVVSDDCFINFIKLESR